MRIYNSNIMVTTINFSLARVWVLIEAGFINFGLILHEAVHKNCTIKDLFMRAVELLQAMGTRS